MEHAGLTAYRFIPPANALGSHTDPDPARANLANSCFCLKNEGFDCLGSGLLNLEPCKRTPELPRGAPIALSLPHFYQADPALLDQFQPDSELRPDEELHSSHIELQPGTGAVLEAVVRLQVNVLYRGLPHIPQLEGRAPTFHPVLWYEVIKENNFLQSTTTSGPVTAEIHIRGRFTLKHENI